MGGTEVWLVSDHRLVILERGVSLSRSGGAMLDDVRLKGKHAVGGVLEQCESGHVPVSLDGACLVCLYVTVLYCWGGGGLTLSTLS